MSSPAASVWLDVWENGMSASPARRPVLLLEARLGAGARPAAWSPGRREAALLDLRMALFGDALESLADCPKCERTVEFTLLAGELLAAAPIADADPDQVRVRVTTADCSAIFRLPNTDDVEAAVRVPAADRRRFLLTRCLTEGEEPGGGWSEEFIDAAARQMSEADPLGDLSLDLNCPDCSHRWEAPFDAGTFLWTELHAWASRLMAEIHALATAYGWTEPEILALPPHRRRFYLECLTRQPL